MSQVEKTKNVVDATNQPNLYERLEAIQGSLALCEKALAEYLETKRLAFPRFYFVSSSDLLDILSNGNNPVSVSPQQQHDSFKVAVNASEMYRPTLDLTTTAPVLGTSIHAQPFVK